MQIALINNNEIIKVGDYREMLPHISFPQNGPDLSMLADMGWVPVTAFRNFDRNIEKIVGSEPYLEDGKVFIVRVVQLTPEEISNNLNSLTASVRAQRDQILKDVVDSINPLRWESFSEQKKQEWRDYRQALLNVPQQQEFPLNVVWPTQPIEE